MNPDAEGIPPTRVENGVTPVVIPVVVIFPALKLLPIFPPMKGEIELLGGLIPAYPTPGIARTEGVIPTDGIPICGIPTEGMPTEGLYPSPAPPIEGKLPPIVLIFPTPIGAVPNDVTPTVETGGIPIEFGTLLPNKLVTGCC